MEICSRCHEFYVYKNDLCESCFNYHKEEIKRDTGIALRTTHLFVLLDIYFNPGITFMQLRANLTSDGMIHGYIEFLNKRNLISLKKEFIGKRPRTSYYITQKGKDMLNQFNSIYQEYVNKKL